MPNGEPYEVDGESFTLAELRDIPNPKWSPKRKAAYEKARTAHAAEIQAAQDAAAYEAQAKEAERPDPQPKPAKANADIGPKFFSLYVPSEEQSAYVRLGGDPKDRAVDDHGRDLTPYFDGGVSPDDTSPGMAKGFIHSHLDMATLQAQSGWVDHTEGHRISTTGGNHVEIVEGDYKLIVCGGYEKAESGIDISAGHMQMWSKTPGYISQVTTSGHEATEYVEATKAYHFRFTGNEYDDEMNVAKVHSVAAKGLGPHKTGPGRPNPAGDDAGEFGLMATYTEVIHSPSGQVKEEFLGETHWTRVMTATLTEHATAGTFDVEVTVGDVRDYAIAVDTASSRDHFDTSMTQTSGSGGAKSTLALTPLTATATTQVGSASSVDSVTMASVSSIDSAGGAISHTSIIPLTNLTNVAAITKLQSKTMTGGANESYVLGLSVLEGTAAKLIDSARSGAVVIDAVLMASACTNYLVGAGYSYMASGIDLSDSANDTDTTPVEDDTAPVHIHQMKLGPGPPKPPMALRNNKWAQKAAEILAKKVW